MTRDEVARIAKLAGIEKDHDVFFSVGEEEMDVHIDDLKRFAELVLESSAEKQKPMAWIVEFENGEQELHFDEPSIGEIHTPLYTSPPQRQPLTDEQITDLYFDGFSISKLKEFARAIEAAHGIKGD